MSAYHRVKTSVGKCDWETPAEVYAYFDRIFNFNLDAAADSHNAKCEFFYSKEDNALSQDWGACRVWLNPPYNQEITKWVRKAYSASRRGALVVMLVKHASDTKWWDIVEKSGACVCRIRGRVKFTAKDREPHGAPWPVVAVIFWPYGGLSLRTDNSDGELFE